MGSTCAASSLFDIDLVEGNWKRPRSVLFTLRKDDYLNVLCETRSLLLVSQVIVNWVAIGVDGVFGSVCIVIVEVRRWMCVFVW